MRPRTHSRLISSSLLALWVLSALPCLAQSTLEAPLGQRVTYTLDAGTLDNPADAWTTIYSKTIVLPGAHWLRLHFDKAVLTDGSYLLVTSTRDGQTHRLDAASLKTWNNSTAYLNGDTLDLQLFAAPHARNNTLSIKDVEAELPDGIAHTRGDSTQCGICTVDGRSPSTENWSGRIMPVGCSGTIICEDSTMISAGHCAGPDQVIQFNVPPSSAVCGTVNPPVADQFPVTAQRSVNSGVGNDWSVYSAGVNTLNQRPFDRYGQLRRLSRTPAAVGDQTSINGYGIDVTCARSQTQQLSTGSVTFRTGTYYSYNNDVRGGNSGSGYLANNTIIGVVTHCSTACGGNIATRIDLPAFAAAINAAMTCDETFAAVFTALGAQPGVTLSPADTGGDAGGPVPLTRTYVPGTTVTASVPSTISAQCFHGWRVNAVDMGPKPTLTFTISSFTTVEAVYSTSCCTADRDDGSSLGFPDGASDISDLLYFLNQFALGTPAVDLDDGSGTGSPDNATNINDLLFFLVRFEAGC